MDKHNRSTRGKLTLEDSVSMTSASFGSPSPLYPNKQN